MSSHRATSPPCATDASIMGATDMGTPVSPRDVEAAVEDVLTADEAIPLRELPPLPKRACGYWTEPILGLCVTLGLCFIFVRLVYIGAERPGPNSGGMLRLATVLIWAEVALALSSVGYLLVGEAGVIHRSVRTCYPMPPEVEERLRMPGGHASRDLARMQNLLGPAHSATHGSYCVRCLVWRPPGQSKKVQPHHCKTCQRCVKDFDHHCGVFGRCIVKGNMSCFSLLIGLVPAAFATAFIAAIA